VTGKMSQIFFPFLLVSLRILPIFHNPQIVMKRCTNKSATAFDLHGTQTFSFTTRETPNFCDDLSLHVSVFFLFLFCDVNHPNTFLLRTCAPVSAIAEGVSTSLGAADQTIYLCSFRKRIGCFSPGKPAGIFATLSDRTPVKHSQVASYRFLQASETSLF